MKFDVVLTNPPFQNRARRGRTPHKIWIDFTKRTFESWLKPNGLLLQVSPASFQSPNSPVLVLMRERTTTLINFDAGRFFPSVGSSFSYYGIRNAPNIKLKATKIMKDSAVFQVVLDDTIHWLPNDFCEESLSIHRKVMFRSPDKLAVEHDYVTCHNALLRRGASLSKTMDAEHPHPVFHTNPQTWYSSVRQPWADEPKIMWSRSGYTKPRLDLGVKGGTDMVYYVVVKNERQGKTLLRNLNSTLFRYLLSTARWSGFGNENVFAALPDLPRSKVLSDREFYDLFRLTPKEQAYVERKMKVKQ